MGLHGVVARRCHVRGFTAGVESAVLHTLTPDQGRGRSIFLSYRYLDRPFNFALTLTHKSCTHACTRERGKTMNHQTRPVRPIDGPLRSRVNQWAHAQGQAHEMRLKAQTMARLEQARAGGAGFDELAALLADIETELAA